MSSEPKVNPLAKHFRQPILYIKLPSGGKWYQDGAIELSAVGEIPVYAMTARDEITMKTPDALMNGASTVAVIESCCPSIKNAWSLPTVDLDTILLAIRLATYGKEMEFTAVCPHCITKNEQAIDVSVLMSRISLGDWSTPVLVAGLEIVLKPQSYEEYNKNNKLNYEEQRIMQLVQNEEISDEDKIKQFDGMFKKLIETGIDQISKSIDYITTQDGVKVTDKTHIVEFLNNCDKSIWDAIKGRLDHIKAQNNYNDIALTCVNEHCAKPFTAPFVFEQTNFFG